METTSIGGFKENQVWLGITILILVTQLSLCQMQRYTWQYNLFISCKIDCSQATHCLQMVNQRSVEIFSSNSAGGSFVSKKLDQGLSRSFSAFSSFIRKYLTPDIKAEQWAQDGVFRTAANNDTDHPRNILAVFEWICKAGMKLKIEKCHFAVRQVDFLGRTFSQTLSPPAHKIQYVLNPLSFPKWTIALQR